MSAKLVLVSVAAVALLAPSIASAEPPRGGPHIKGPGHRVVSDAEFARGEARLRARGRGLGPPIEDMRAHTVCHQLSTEDFWAVTGVWSEYGGTWCHKHKG